MRFRPRARLKQFAALQRKYFSMIQEAGGDLHARETGTRSLVITKRVGNLLRDSRIRYVKIWPEMLNCLRHVKMDIPVESLPHVPPFEVLVPVGYDWCGSPYEPFTAFELNSLVVDVLPGDWVERSVMGGKTTLSDQERARRRESVWISTFCNCHEGTSAQLYTFDYGQTVEEKLAKMDQGRDVDRRFREVIAVAVSTLLFISDEHELLIRDFETPVVERGRGRKRRKALRQFDEQQPVVGWKLATKHEKDLPTPIQRGSSSSTGSNEGGSKLQFQSKTRAHMRWQPYGPGLRDRKLIFIESYTRGKHLPKRQIHGFRIPDRVLKRDSKHR